MLFVVGVLLAALFLGTVGWVFVNSQDTAAPDVSDLIPDMVSVPDPNNAYLYIRRATALLRWPADGRPIELGQQEWDDAFVRGMLSRNEEALFQLELGLACSDYLAHDASGLRSPVAEPWDRMAVLLAQKAAYERRIGLNDVACETSCGLLRLGVWIMSRPRSMTEWRRGQAALILGLDAIERLVHEVALSEADLVLLLERLNRIDTLDRGTTDALKRDFQHVNQAIDDRTLRTPARSLLAGYKFQPNRTRAAAAQFYRRLIQNVPRAYAEQRLPEIPRLRMHGIHRYLLVLRPNRQGRMMTESLLRDACPWDKCSIQSDLDGLRLVIACRIHEVRHGSLPEKLDALVPELLRGVPCDPFDGKPFRYDREQAVVYSVGYDLKDSGGMGGGPPSSLPGSHIVEPSDGLDWPEYPFPQRMLPRSHYEAGDLVYHILPGTE